MFCPDCNLYICDAKTGLSCDEDLHRRGRKATHKRRSLPHQTAKSESSADVEGEVKPGENAKTVQYGESGRKEGETEDMTKEQRKGALKQKFIQEQKQREMDRRLQQQQVEQQQQQQQ